MAAHRFAALLGTGPAGVLLTLTDHLAVAGLEHEVVLAVAALLHLERTLAQGIAPHRLDAVERRIAGLVLFAGKDDLAVAGQQVEVELAIAGLLQLELAGGHGNTSCAVRLATREGRVEHGCDSRPLWGRSSQGGQRLSCPPARRQGARVGGSMKRDPPTHPVLRSGSGSSPPAQCPAAAGPPDARQRVR